MDTADPGYTDTPELPHCEYRVHDATRPRPPHVDPGQSDRTQAPPPADATVLLDGSDFSAWEDRDGESIDWTAAGDYVEVEPQTGQILTRDSFGDCHLHLEWATPEEISGEGQGRGNSGVFLMNRYEIQILDNYENPTYADGYAGAVYGQHPPLVNASRPPGDWQTYDIFWRRPRFDGDDCSEPARVTVLHNGILVQNNVELIGQTTHRKVAEYTPHPETAPIKLQDHGDSVRFRNAWIRSVEDAE